MILAASACDDDGQLGVIAQESAQARFVNAWAGGQDVVGVEFQGRSVAASIPFQGSQCARLTDPASDDLATFVSGGEDVATTIAGAIAPGGRFTVILFGPTTPSAPIVLPDPAPTVRAPDGQNLLRFFNATGTVGSVWAATADGTYAGQALAALIAPGTAAGANDDFVAVPIATPRVALFAGAASTPEGEPIAEMVLPELTGNRVATVVFTPSVDGGPTAFAVVPCP